jgi:hypothetical protein
LLSRISQYAAPLVFFAVVGTVLVAVAVIRPPEIILFEGVEGPADPTPLAVSAPADWRAFAGGGTSRLAVLLTDTTSSWLGVAHGLKTIGVPFRITLDYEDALRHDVVLVYPRISGRLLSPDALRALAEFPERGGTLIGVNVEGGGLASVFGFTEAVPSRERNLSRTPRFSHDTRPPLGCGPRTSSRPSTFGTGTTKHFWTKTA